MGNERTSSASIGTPFLFGTPPRDLNSRYRVTPRHGSGFTVRPSRGCPCESSDDARPSEDLDRQSFDRFEVCVLGVEREAVFEGGCGDECVEDRGAAFLATQ